MAGLVGSHFVVFCNISKHQKEIASGKGQKHHETRRLLVDIFEEMPFFQPEAATVSRIKNKSAKRGVFFCADLGPRLREPWHDPGFES